MTAPDSRQLLRQGEPDAILTSDLWEGEGHHPDVTKTETGCHVWRGSTYGPCFKHGTVGCCLLMHASPAAQRAFNKPRCGACGRFLRGDSYYVNRCSDCWTPADEFI